MNKSSSRSKSNKTDKSEGDFAPIKALEVLGMLRLLEAIRK